MRRILLGLFVLLHGFAHANIGVWAFNAGPTWLVTALWGVAMLAYVAAAFGILRVPVLRSWWWRSASSSESSTRTSPWRTLSVLKG